MMAEIISANKNSFSNLIKILEDHENHYGSIIIDDMAVISILGYCIDYGNEKKIDYSKLESFVRLNREKIMPRIMNNLKLFGSEIEEVIGTVICAEFGDEILEFCSPTSESNDSIQM